VVVLAGLTLCVPLVAIVPVQPSLAVQEVALVLDQVNIELPPDAMFVGLAEMVAVGTMFTVVVAVTALPTVGVTVSVYVVFTLGLTGTGVPLVAGLLKPPGAVITPVPPVKFAVNCVLDPELIGLGLAVKLVIVGAGTTVTMAVAVTADPLAGVTVSVYVVVVPGFTLAPTPLVTDMFPGVITPVPPEKTAVNVELCPAPMVDGFAPKLVMVGGFPPPPPPPLFDEPPQPARIPMHIPANTA